MRKIIDSGENSSEWGCIATGFGEYAQDLCEGGMWQEQGYASDFEDGSGYRAANDWLKEHDRDVAVKALKDMVAEIRFWHNGSWNLVDPLDQDTAYSVDVWIEVMAERMKGD